MTAVMRFFGLTPGPFKTEWVLLSDQDKKDLKDGITDGSYTYADTH